MKGKRARIILFAALAAVGVTGQAQQIDSMKVLSPSVGWAASNAKLFWTTNGGSHWKGITPPRQGPESIADVFFLDESRGWVLLDTYAADEGLHAFRIASTTNSGETWDVKPLALPGQKPSLSGNGWLDFVDSSHGWLVLPAVTSSAFSWGLLLTTEDGGANWKELPPAPIAGRPMFVTTQKGWIYGNGGTGGVYQTDDGGVTWHGGGPDLPRNSTYENLGFSDPLHGFMLIQLDLASGSTLGAVSAMRLFVTTDGGKNWRQDRALEHPYGEVRVDATAVLPDSSGEDLVLLATLHKKNSDVLYLATVPPHATTAASQVDATRNRNARWQTGDHIERLSFVSRTNGWALTVSGEVLSTSDGGSTWQVITPGAAPRRSVPRPGKVRGLKQNGAVSESSGLVLVYGQNLAFDRNNVPVVNLMSDWWDNSPFWAIGIYVGGQNYCGARNNNKQCISQGVDPGLTTGSNGWLTQAQNQGWDFIPIWVGQQAPCVNTPNLYEFNASTAASQGATEAASAQAAMAGYGLSGTVVFYDMEQYNANVGDSCSLAVRAFLNAWVTAMNGYGYQVIGVYGNGANAQSDFSTIPGLTEVWISNWGTNNIATPQATIWGMTGLCDPFSSQHYCSYWSQHQRIRQYLGEKTVAYGGSPAINIDFDIVDAQIVGTPSGGYAPPQASYTVVSIGSGSTSTTPTSLNDEGAVVGYASVPLGTYGCPISDWCAFTYSNGNFTWVQYQYQGAYQYTYFTGINDLGTIVGYSGLYGLSYDGTTFTQLNYPGAYATYPEGINDDGTVVGIWTDGTSSHGFIEYGGTWESFDYPGAEDTYLYTINGDGVIGGEYYTSSAGFDGFIYDSLISTYIIVPPYPGAISSDAEDMVSNNGQTPGSATMSGGSTVYFIYDFNLAGFSSLSNITTWPSSMNDYGQLIGGTGSNAYLGTPNQ